MRTRAYRPEISDCLEDRSLLSSVPRLSADPIVLPRLQLKRVFDHTRLGFETFAKDLGPSHPYNDDNLLETLYNVAVIIPYGGVDGLGVKINRIVDNLHEDLSAHVPHAIRTAAIDVSAAYRAEVLARVRSGDVIVR